MAPVALESLGQNGDASAPLSASSQNRLSANQQLTSGSDDKSNVIKFNVTKNELYKLDDGYKTLQRRQRGLYFPLNMFINVQSLNVTEGYWKIVNNSNAITSDMFAQSRVFVLAGPREKFTENEIDHLKRYLETGGSILVLLGEGGEKR